MPKQLNKKGFKMGHLNIQGVQNKFDEVDLMLTSSDNDIHILGLSRAGTINRNIG